MKDINFFSVYSKQKGSSRGKTLKAVLIAAVVVLLIGGSYVALTLYRTGLDREAARIDAYLMSDEVRDQVAAINKYNYDQSIIDQYEQMVEQVLKNLEASKTMDSARLATLSAALPVGVTMKSISISGNTAGMAFYVPDMATAAQLVAALSALDDFTSVALTNIDGSDPGIYIAELTAGLKGGDAE